MCSSSTATASTLARTFTSSSIRARAPTLADITPNSAAEFDKKQAEFRSSRKAAHKVKKEQDS